MAKKTFYVVQPYELGKRGVLKAGVPMEVRTADDAMRVAKRMALVKAGAVAFSRAVDPETEDADEAVLIGSFGAVPEGALDAA
ncbi:hypothetical protein GGQ86_003010 [Xanthobacter flavus]|uniref:Uncharacterized protein n=1 Tax=Xanthobacter flavus TaxID=281 RepID=A0A9W6CQD5_XANFL|nr:hypothetical protein [Xanthobacter flavus]MDR6334528.1 hypothetical protein [Xanthobacter flavus]GLI23454.1 hypothetical protein XFLAVUS301_31280 [Xanthobacter flavus]